MGLHSGEPTHYDEGHVGMDVHRAARIAAATHGGQVVLSDVTRQLAESQLPRGVSMLDLGWHRLNDIESPEHLYQVVIAGLQERFLPLYARERLEQAGESDSACRRHADYYAAFAERAQDRLQGRAQWAWLDRLESGQDNLRAALSWSLAGPTADTSRTTGRISACGWCRIWARSGTSMVTPGKRERGWKERLKSRRGDWRTAGTGIPLAGGSAAAARRRRGGRTAFRTQPVDMA
jgi:hypothetical protein